jgi:hypothetical protein
MDNNEPQVPPAEVGVFIGAAPPASLVAAVQALQVELEQSADLLGMQDPDAIIRVGDLATLAILAGVPLGFVGEMADHGMNDEKFAELPAIVPEDPTPTCGIMFLRDPAMGEPPPFGFVCSSRLLLEQWPDDCRTMLSIEVEEVLPADSTVYEREERVVVCYPPGRGSISMGILEDWHQSNAYDEWAQELKKFD